MTFSSVVAMGLAARLVLLALVGMAAGAIASSEVVRLDDERRRLGASVKEDPEDEDDDDADEELAAEESALATESDGLSSEVAATEAAEGGAAAPAAGDPAAEDAHVGELLTCQEKGDKMEKEMVAFQTEAASCASKLNVTELASVKAERKATEEEDLRAKAILETQASVAEEKKAVALAEKEKAVRKEAEESCKTRSKQLEDANAAMLAAREATVTVHATEVVQKGEALRLKQAQNMTATIATMNEAKEQAVSQAQDEMNEAISAARDAGKAAVQAMINSLDSEEAKARAQEALAFEATKHEYADKIRQAAVDRDEAVNKAQGERDEVLKELHDLQAEANDAKAGAREAARARTEAERSLAKYKKWAENQLNTAKDSVLQATVAAQSVTKSVYATVEAASKPKAIPANGAATGGPAAPGDHPAGLLALQSLVQQQGMAPGFGAQGMPQSSGVPKSTPFLGEDDNRVESNRADSQHPHSFEGTPPESSSPLLDGAVQALSMFKKGSSVGIPGPNEGDRLT